MISRPHLPLQLLQSPNSTGHWPDHIAGVGPTGRCRGSGGAQRGTGHGHCKHGDHTNKARAVHKRVNALNHLARMTTDEV